MSVRLGRLRTPAEPLRGPARAPRWLAAVVFAALTYLVEVRSPADPPVWNSLWAEDGREFLGGALSHTFPDPILEPHTGYIHLVSRLFAEVASILPIERAPLAISLLSAATVAALVLFVYLASGAWIASPVLRGVLAGAFALLPAAAGELNANSVNVSVFLIYACFWALLCPWATRGWVVARTSVAVLAILSNGLAVLLLPVAAFEGLRARDHRSRIVPAAFAAGVVVQLVLGGERPERFRSFHAGDIPHLFAERVASSLLVGDRFLDDLFGGASGSPFAWICLAAVTGLCALGLWRTRGRRRALLAVCIPLALAFFVVPMIARGTGVLSPAPTWLDASRYVYPPIMFLLTGLLAAMDRSEPGRGPLPAREVAVAAVVAVVVLSNYALPHAAADGPAWRASLDQARVECARLPVGGPRVVQVPIMPPGWAVRLDCADVED